MTRSREELADLARHHAAIEGDPRTCGGVQPTIDALLETLDDDPVYELLPVGIAFRGKDAARRYYEHFFSTFAPMVAGGRFRSEYVGADGLCLEYAIAVRAVDGSVTTHPIISTLVFGEERLAGERVYGSDAFLRLLFGPLFDEATPI